MVAKSTRRVVVGVADTPSGRAAFHAAVLAAQQRGATLELVRVWRDIDRLFSMTLSETRRLSDSQRHDRQLLDDFRQAVALVAPDLPCTGELLRGDLYEDLLHRSEGADLLVLGAGDESNSSHLIGEWFRRHATCPVQLVQPEAEPSRS